MGLRLAELLTAGITKPPPGKRASLSKVRPVVERTIKILHQALAGERGKLSGSSQCRLLRFTDSKLGHQRRCSAVVSKKAEFSSQLCGQPNEQLKTNYGGAGYMVGEGWNRPENSLILLVIQHFCGTILRDGFTMVC